MAASRIEADEYFQVDNEYYNEELHKVILSILPQFDKMIRSYIRFNILFSFFAFIELVLLSLFFTFLVQSSFVAFSFAMVFLTLFSYFVLRLYFQAKKPQQFDDFIERFGRGCKNIIKYREGFPEHHVALANSYCKLAVSLQGREYIHYRPPGWLEAFVPTLEKFSCWCFWQDHHKMKELLLESSVREHIKLVKSEPTSLDVHAALANAYVMLSSLYVDPRKSEDFDEDRWIPTNNLVEEYNEKFRTIAKKAIEEFKILNDYAPNDPWVHTQLAYSYHDLQMPEEEIKEYETILKLRPDDKEILFKLGCLYFQQGQNAKGLKLYEQLKHSNLKKAEHLISFYGSNDY